MSCASLLSSLLLSCAVRCWKAAAHKWQGSGGALTTASRNKRCTYTFFRFFLSEHLTSKRALTATPQNTIKNTDIHAHRKDRSGVKIRKREK